MTCSAYGFCCRTISQYKGIDIKDIALVDMFYAGVVTGVVQTPVRQVVERIKSVMQVHEIKGGKQAYKWSGECFVELIRTQGVRKGLFQGMSSVLLREVAQFAVYYPCYEMTKTTLSKYIKNQMLLQFVSGGIAGTVQWLPPIYFADVLKSRMQTAPPGFYKGSYDCATKLLREEGYQVFFRGLTPAILRAFPLHAIIFVGYETTMSYLRHW
jgi:solute carrier family 25 (mitochondrial carnitine/acylcarnitine transporter), member 20/29